MTWVSSFGKCKGNLGSLAFVTLGRKSVPDTCDGFCRSLLREVDGGHVRPHFESVKTLKGPKLAGVPYRLHRCKCELIDVKAY